MTKTYTEEFKQDAVRLAETSGKPKVQVARDLGVSETALYRWIKDYGTHQASLGQSEVVRQPADSRSTRAGRVSGLPQAGRPAEARGGPPLATSRASPNTNHRQRPSPASGSEPARP